MCRFLFCVDRVLRCVCSLVVFIMVGFLVLGSFSVSWLFRCIEIMIGFCLFFRVLVWELGRFILKFRVSSGVVIMKMMSSISIMLM